ncbi:hypothetical protein FRB94_013163 [Tulasnella sp. JGI-2019a]|nr:hypothetical protein FRB94_013163 [Tulasnella sp. JGI-2019a]
MQLPSPSLVEKQDQIILEAWQDATELGTEDVSGLPLTKKYYGLLSGVWWQVQGCFKSKVKLIIEVVHKFVHSNKKADMLENRRRYKMLTSGKMPYMCEDLETLQGHWYSHTAFSVIHHVCFATVQLNGFRCATYFQLFLLPLLALAYAVIKCTINEWEKGEWTAIKFRGDTYHHEYCMILVNLCNLLWQSPELDKKFRDDCWIMHQSSCLDEKVKVTLDEEDQQAVLHDFECIMHDKRNAENGGRFSDS